MNVKRKKEKLLKKIERQKQRTDYKEVKLKAKIKDKKTLIKLEQELESAKTLDIKEADLALIKKDKTKGVGGFLRTKAFPVLKQWGKDWAEKNHAENERQRKAMEESGR